MVESLLEIKIILKINLIFQILAIRHGGAEFAHFMTSLIWSEMIT